MTHQEIDARVASGAYAVLETPSDDLLAQVVRAAAQLTGRPMAALSVGTDEPVLLAAYGGEATTALAAAPPGDGEVAGVALISTEGEVLGSLSVRGPDAGRLSAEQRQTLTTLAGVAAGVLRSRRAASDLAASLRGQAEAQERAWSMINELISVFDGVAEGLVLVDSDGIVQRVNPAFCALLGGDDTAYLGRRWRDLVVHEGWASEAAALDDLCDHQQAAAVRDLTMVTPSGHPFAVLASSTAARRPDGSVSLIVTQVEDIQPRRQAEIELRESQSALDGIITIDGGERIVSWNEGASRLFGYDRSAAIGQDLSMIVPDFGTAARDHGLAHPGAQECQPLNATLELEALTAGRTVLPIELSLSRWSRGDEPFYTAVIRDISERRRHEQEREWLATHDLGTGLPTMVALAQWFEEHCAGLPEGRLRAVFCLQLTNLSEVSAALGAAASEELLGRIGESFAAAALPDLVICHLRDTHFGGAVVMDADPHPTSFRQRLIAVARYVSEAGCGPYEIGGVRVEMHVQIGVVATGRASLTFLELLRHAEATRDSSHRHINVAEEVVAAGDPAGVRDLTTLSDLHDAVPRGQLELHYQPLTALQPRQVSRDGAPAEAPPQMVEALLRWRHPRRGLVPPGDFIPLIERSRLMVDVTEWVLDEALAQQSRWRDAGLDVRVAVNVSPQVLLNSDVVAMVQRALDTSGADADRLKLEITESAIVDNPEQARDLVAALRRLGVHVSLDDFGTGYTSLRFLRDFEVDELKLDRLFVANATTNPADAAIANVVAQLGQRLGIRTVAESIEEVESRSLFRAFGYDYMQGFLDSRPLPAPEIEGWLRAHAPEGPGSGAGPAPAARLDRHVDVVAQPDQPHDDADHDAHDRQDG